MNLLFSTLILSAFFVRAGTAATKMGILEDSRRIEKGKRIVEFAFEKTGDFSWKIASTINYITPI